MRLAIGARHHAEKPIWKPMGGQHSKPIDSVILMPDTCSAPIVANGSTCFVPVPLPGSPIVRTARIPAPVPN